MRYLLVGNYGVGNPGDEALKEYFLQRFPEVEWVVVSASPGVKEVSRLPFGPRSLFTPWWQTVRVYWQCDGVVFGGGSLFTDTESSWAPFLWWWHVALAVFLRKPVFLAFQGLGPFQTRIGEPLAHWAAQKAVFLSVRDAFSFRRVERWGLNKKCVLSFDPVFSRIDDDIRLRSCFAAMPDDSGRSKNLLIIPRKNSSKKFLQRMAEMKENWQVNPLPRAPLPLRRERGDVCVVEPKSFSELCEAVSSASFLLTQRYHAGIVALALGVPFEAVPQIAGDKLDALNREERDSGHLRERVLVGEEELRKALQASSPRGRGLR